MRRSALLGVAGVSLLVSPAGAGVPTAQELLVPARVLERLDLTQRAVAEIPLPDDPTCRHLVAANEQAASTKASTAFQRWSTDDEEVQFTNTVRVFATEADARAFVRTYRLEDPTEDCVEAFLAPQDPTVEADIRADDREGVRLGHGVVVVPYLAQATFFPEEGEIEVKAELVIARKGATVSDTFFLAPEDRFGNGARIVERAVARVLRGVDG